MEFPSRRLTPARLAAAFVAGSFAVLPLQPAAADALLGPYIGGAIGEAQVQADASSYSASQFKENHSAYKGMFGIRPISTLGLEIAYMDFGDPSVNGSTVSDVKMRGAAAFALFYLPVPVVDVYAKLGVARIQSTVSGAFSVCTLICVAQPFQADRTDTGLAGGLGVQLKLGSAAVRAEYERFTAAGAYPALVSLGFTWTFR
jgi:opacity protein-like surface antigen